MFPASPIVLATVAGNSATQRLQLLLVSLPEGGNRLELRQQSWSETVGWYTQNGVSIDPEQVAELRNSLGLGGAAGRLKNARPYTDGAPTSPLRIVG
jgi:hypothetical protein